MRGKGFIILLSLLVPSYSGAAKIHHQLSVKACTKLATHVVIATEDIIIDGQLTVLESLKGDLKPGENLVIPELAAFRSQESRVVDCLFPLQLWCYDAPKKYVTGSRMILFLIKNSQPLNDRSSTDAATPLWTGAIGKRRVYQSTIWIEGSQSFAFYDASENERGILADFERSEEEIKISINIALET